MRRKSVRQRLVTIAAALFFAQLIPKLTGQTTVDFQGAGDGITDNQAAFSTAIAVLNAAGGGALRIHAGTYAHSGAVAFGMATNVICDKGAVLKATTDSAAAMILSGANSGIEGCRFISGANAPLSGDNASAVVFSNCQTCYGTDNSIQGGAGDGYLVSGTGSNVVQIRGGLISGVLGNGVRVKTGASEVVVEGILITRAGLDCIGVISVAADGARIHDVDISHNQCQAAGGNGIQIAGVLRAKVSGNVVNSPGQNGVIVRNFTPTETFVPDSIDILNNTITNQTNTAYFSIGLEATQNSTAAGNTIRNASGINQWAQSSHLMIEHNRLFNISGEAIKLYFSLDHFSVVGNTIFTVQYSCVKAVSVSDGIIAGNSCWDARTSGVTTWGAYHLENTLSVCPLFTGGTTGSGSNFVSYAGNFDPSLVKTVNAGLDANSTFCDTFRPKHNQGLRP